MLPTDRLTDKSARSARNFGRSEDTGSPAISLSLSLSLSLSPPLSLSRAIARSRALLAGAFKIDYTTETPALSDLGVTLACAVPAEIPPGSRVSCFHTY